MPKFIIIISDLQSCRSVYSSPFLRDLGLLAVIKDYRTLIKIMH